VSVSRLGLSTTGKGGSSSQGSAEPPTPKGRKAPLLAVIAWLAVSAVLEFLLGWYLARVGSSLYKPVLVVLLVAVVIFVVGLWRFGLGERKVGVDWGLWIIGVGVLVAAAYLYLVLPVAVLMLGLMVYFLRRRYPSMRGGGWQPDREQFPNTGRPTKAAWVLGLGSVVVFFAAACWAVEWVLPLQAQSQSAVLDRLAVCAIAHTVSCQQAENWNVPGLGEIPRSDITLVKAGEVQFGQTDGYLYAPGLSLSEVTADVGSNLPCVRHLYGPWWEFDAAPNNVFGCPWGFYFQASG
jgi:hypothetical protein